MTGNGKLGTVLVVDDMKLARLKLKQVCTAMGFSQIVEATNGNEAWTMLDIGTIKPDLILSDYNMPDMNGIQFLEKIRSKKETAGMPVVLVTSESEKGLILSAVSLQVTDFVVKPFSDEDIIKKIKSALSKRKAS